MDYFLSVFLVFVASFFFLLNRRRIDSSNSPPGSLGLPLIGETLQLFLSENPEGFVRKRLEKHSTEVFKTNLLGENAVVFSGADANKFMTANEEKLVRAWPTPSQKLIFASAKPKPKSPMQNADKAPPGVSQLIAHLRPDSKAVEKFDFIAKNRLRKYCCGEGRDEVVVVRAYELVKSFVLTLSCSHLLGMGLERAAEAAAAWRFNDLANGLQSIHVDLPGTVFWRAKRAAAEARRGIKAIAKEEGSSGEAGDNVLSFLMAGNGILPETEANIAMGLMAASYGSVVTTIAFMVKFVGERPDVYHKIYSEQLEIVKAKGNEALNWNHINKMKYTWAVASETMRIAPSFFGSFREALVDFDYAGFTVPKGWKILWAVNMTNKNPEYFPDPKKFDPSRFVENKHLPFAFLPFGGGPRMCTGQEYARLAILTFFHNLVTSYKWDILSPGEKISGGLGLPVPANGLPIRLYPHSLPGSITKKEVKA